MTADSAATGKRKKSGKPPRELSPEELEIRELAALCKAGKLFDVQKWIAAGCRLNPPEKKGPQPASPLHVAIDQGFHSLVETLLKGGAHIDHRRWTGSMDRALRMRRLDLAQLLVDHGFDPRSVEMDIVFLTWDAEIIEFFIDRGADVETGSPLASALGQRMYPALRVFKRYQDKFPHFQAQLDEALRHHCQEGDAKWFSLLIWAGADAYSSCGECGWSALETAAFYGQFHLFRLRQLTLKPDHRALQGVLYLASRKSNGIELAERLIRLGVPPNDQENGGCSEVHSLLINMSWESSVDSRGQLHRKTSSIDGTWARDSIQAIHFLVKNGARWSPKDASDISAARRSLLKMIPEYILEFVWIMAKYQACTKESIAELLRSHRMDILLRAQKDKLGELLARWN